MPGPIDHTAEPLDEWRPGVQTRMLVSAVNGATRICMFEQFCAPDTGAPTHRHTVEEVLTLRAGIAEIWTGDQRVTLTAGQSVIVPADVPHGFRNVGPQTLHVTAILAAPIFEAVFEGQSEARRRWTVD